MGLRQGGTPQDPGGDGSSLFPSLPIANAVEQLDRTALFPGLQLPASAIETLETYARSATLRHNARDTTFEYDQVRDGRLPGGEPAVIAIVVGADQHPLVLQIANDPQVRQIVRRYLGYAPPRLNIRLLWSFVTSVADADRVAAAQTIDYHFDVQSYNFIYANYYLSNVDARSGAHAMILASHREKPLPWLLGSVRQEREAILHRYGAESEVVIEGPAGFGFVQDAACYHKAMAPVDRERLMLQIRYY